MLYLKYNILKGFFYAMLEIIKNAKLMLKTKQAKNLFIFVPKKTKSVKLYSTHGNLQKTEKFKTGLTSRQLRYIKRFRHCYTTKEVSHTQAEKRKAKRSKTINILSFVFNVAILAVVLLLSFVGQEDKTQVLFPAIDWRWIGGLAGLLALQLLIEAVKYIILIKTATKKSRPNLAYKIMVLGKYYDAVTPMSSGGQPFQMMYLNKHGIKGDVATSIPLVRYMFWQITYVIICSVILIYNNFCPVPGSQLFSVLVAWIAVGANLAIVLTVLFLSVSKKVGPHIVIWFLKLGSKLHIIKNYRVTFRKVMRFVVNYQKTMRMFAKNAGVLILQLLLAAAEIIISNILTYFIYRAFVPNGTLSPIDITVLSIICSLTVGFIPTPGASGGAEAFFAAIFGPIFGGNYFWPLLLWRIATYYFHLLHGLVVLIYDFLIGNKKYERQRQREMGIEPTEPTFRTTLAENRKSIMLLQDQEEDKLLVPTMLSSKAPKTREDENEIIKDGDIVSLDEMKKEVRDAEQVLATVRLKEIKKRREKNIKRQIKAKIKTQKHIKESTDVKTEQTDDVVAEQPAQTQIEDSDKNSK